VAARYIAEQYRQLGLKPVAGQSDFFQRIPFERVKSANSGTLIVDKDTLRLGKELLVMNGNSTDLTGNVIYAGYGLTDGEDGYKGRDVKGRIVVVQGGSPEAKSPGEIFRASNGKRRLATEKGAAALIELYSESIPWGMVSQNFNREQISVPVSTSGAVVTHVWINNQNNKFARLKEGSPSITLRTSGRIKVPAPSANVAGVIEGTDPTLKNEYVVLTAHFDHVGVGKQGGSNYTPADSNFQRCP